MNKLEMVSRQLLELMTCGAATKVTIEFDDGNTYARTLPDATENYIEWTERNGQSTMEYIAQIRTRLEEIDN